MAGWLRAFLGCCALVFSGCGFETATLTLWTDAPEFAFYAQAFNTAQVKYKIEVHEKRTLGLELETAARERRPLPDIVAGKWLKAASLLGLWQKTDFLFAKNSVHKKMFYDVLLEFGRNGKEQLLLPVSFNLGAMVFMPDAVPSTPPLAALSAPNPAPLTLAEVRRAGAAFNLLSGGVYTRTGFSPTWEWNGDFLYTAARLYGAVFEEGAPLSWERGTLTSAVARLKDWLNEENGGAQAEDDFVFKYSYNPPLRLIEQGRILFAYVKSNVLFTAPPEELEQLDFRWLAAEDTDGEKISVLEDVLLLGITKKCAAKNAAAAFVKWFYSDYTQRELLKGSKAAYMGAPIFGIASGFSAVRSVTESAFPPKYPALLAHIPPDDSLRAPPPLPWNWSNLKERVIVPYIRERVKTDEAPTRNLEQRLADWARMNNQILQAIRD